MVTSAVATVQAFGVPARNPARHELRCWIASAHTLGSQVRSLSPNRAPFFRTTRERAGARVRRCMLR